MKFNSLSLVSALLLSVISGCKYEEGPGISLRSACKRIDGTYEVTKYTIGGYDSTAALRSKPCYGKIVFDTNDIYGNREDLNCKFSGQYSLNNGNRSISILFFSNFPSMPPIGIHEVISWDIIELRNDEMTFKTVYNGKECILELKE